MFLTNEPNFYVFELNDSKFDLVGDLTQATGAIWGESYSGCAPFQMWVPINETTREVLKSDNVVWLDGDNVAGIIEYVHASYDDDGTGTFEIKGRTLESLLERRFVVGTYKVTNKSVSYVMRGLVAANAVNPTDVKRVVPYLEIEESTDDYGGTLASYQKTGNSVYEALEDLCESYGLGYRLNFDPINKKLVFEVLNGDDKTIGGEGDTVVVFSDDLDDVLESEYTTNSQDFRNVAFVAGEASGGSRTSVYVGDSESSGFARRELYVDARDLQSETYDESGESRTMTPEEYEQALTGRGNEKLAESVVQESFSASVRPLSYATFVYGVDYFIGDIITFESANLGLRVNARVEAVQAEYGDSYSLALTVGYEMPTIMERVRRVSKN